MFGSNKHKSAPIDSLIGSGSKIDGNVSFGGGLRVDGHVRGNISAKGDKPGTLVLSEAGKIEGEIDVAHVVINGCVVGPVRSSEFVELLPKARVLGDVFYQSIEMHVGAVVTGRLVHEGPKQDRVVELVEFKPLAGN
jgi:cytoskeletal protein CcmA (bactofilin family)